jgi:dienelactone hydrolase
MPILESEKDVRIPIGRIVLQGSLALPREARGVVLFAHGSGSSRLSPRNRYVASVLQEAGLATLLFDLLTPDEERIDDVTGELRFDIPFLAERLIGATDWLLQQTDIQRVQLGYFGASTGAAAALIAAAQRTDVVRAVVSRGGRPDLAGPALPNVLAPTLLIVGARDETVLRLNRQALADLKCKKELAIVPGATHLFEEPGTLEEAARLARDWFVDCLSGAAVGA